MRVDLLPKKFVERIAVQADGCWRWTGGLYRRSYAAVWFEGKMQRAHRVVYSLLVGPIPPGLDLDHQCHNRNRDTCPGGEACLHRRCVNPAHLEPATRSDNTRRGLGTRLRTTCRKRDHDITAPGALYVAPDGGRECAACRRERR